MKRYLLAALLRHLGVLDRLPAGVLPRLQGRGRFDVGRRSYNYSRGRITSHVDDLGAIKRTTRANGATSTTLRLGDLYRRTWKDQP
jgi:hypothetical protein